MPSLVTKILSSSSLPVNSSATTYKLGCNFRAASNMYCKGTVIGVREEKDGEEGGGRARCRFDIDR